ncbi:MAG: hypothetical protein HS130_07380 [Deltaproteobacteria bacterium]|nr:hypothetical protein [Deltaproteobacteria bacterium]
MPLKVNDGHLLVALTGPKGIFTVAELERITGFPVRPVFADEGVVNGAINRFFDRLSGSAKDVMDGLGAESLTRYIDIGGAERPIDLTDEAPIIKLLNSLLFKAVKAGRATYT